MKKAEDEGGEKKCPPKHVGRQHLCSGSKNESVDKGCDSEDEDACDEEDESEAIST